MITTRGSGEIESHLLTVTSKFASAPAEQVRVRHLDALWLAEREAERQSQTKLAYRAPIDQGVTPGDFKRELVVDLPDGADQGGVRLLAIGNLVEIKLRNRPHLPFVRPLEDGAEKEFAVLVRREIGGDIEVRRPPVRALRHDAGPARADA